MPGQALLAPNGKLGKLRVIGIATVPLFVTVNVCTALVCPMAMEPNACEVGETVIGAAPVPVNEIVCVPTLSTIVMTPVNELMFVGVKMIEIVQLFPAANEPPVEPAGIQLVVSVKLALFDDMPVIGSATVPLFVSLTVAGLLLALTTTEPKACDVAESVAVWAQALGADKAKSTNVTTRIPMDARDSLLDFISTSLTGLKSKTGILQ